MLSHPALVAHLGGMKLTLISISTKILSGISCCGPVSCPYLSAVGADRVLFEVVFNGFLQRISPEPWFWILDLTIKYADFQNLDSP
jgi:hypothetical protein